MQWTLLELYILRSLSYIFMKALKLKSNQKNTLHKKVAITKKDLVFWIILGWGGWLVTPVNPAGIRRDVYSFLFLICLMNFLF